MELIMKKSDKRITEQNIKDELPQPVRQMKKGRKGKAHSSVAQARYRVGLSQSQFVALLGVSMRTLQDWEQGRREPSGAARTLLKIAETRPEVLRELAA